MLELDKIYLGDAYELIKQIPDKSVDLIYTDPPYKIGTGGMTGLFNRPNRRNGGVYMKEIMAGGFHDGYNMAILDEFVRVMKFINIYIWCNKEQLREYLNYFNDKNCNFEIIVWAKPTFPPFTNGHFCKDKELCLYFWEKNKIKITGSWEEMKTVINHPINNEDKNDYGHPTIKPLMEVMQRIKTSTNENDLVLDPFMGSGTTAVACKEVGRNFIGFEINEKYHKIATDRLNGIKKNGQMSLLETDFELL